MPKSVNTGNQIEGKTHQSFIPLSKLKSSCFVLKEINLPNLFRNYLKYKLLYNIPY
jgi:hypothetical protein